MKHRDHLVGFLLWHPTPSSGPISPLPLFLILSFPCFALSQCPLTDDYFLLAAQFSPSRTPGGREFRHTHPPLSAKTHTFPSHPISTSTLFLPPSHRLSALDVRASCFGWPMIVVRHLPISVLVARPSTSETRVSSFCYTSSLPKPGFFLRLLFRAGFRFKHHLFLFSFPIFLYPLIRSRSKTILDLRTLQTRFNNSDPFTMHVLGCSDFARLYC